MATLCQQKIIRLRCTMGRVIAAVWLMANFAGATGGVAAPARVAKTTTTRHDPFLEARFSLSMRGAPLHRMLSLLETTSGLHFRYGAVPDVVVDTTFNNAPLLPTLENLLRSEGFQMQRNGREVFIFRSLEPIAPTPQFHSFSGIGAKPKVRTEIAQLTLPLSTPKHNLPLPVAWYYWTRTTPPPADWLLGLNATKAVNQAVTGVWQLATLIPDSRQRAGIAVVKAIPPLKKSMKKPDDERLWLRWPIALRQVPSGAQLLLETPSEATLYVNGAPLLRRWQGARLIDLSHVLHPGLNCLALYWPHTAPSTGDLADSALLHYEWFFSTPPGAAAKAGADSGSAEATGELTISGSGLAAGSRQTPSPPSHR
ncbi:MAG: hypothetical protein JO316_02600 [Abitibacteriaceae bacterium]|nr:hypothetical protein [Abditibacteriaceae bacterium]